ncbi:bifunctional 4-hydroxy-2-oxoglutarate aldolase/2-dehydro-3-deoxy-phosphogluconate aldolase [Mycolicibacterium sp. S2-37]|uniref:bifunctional 4-hydroxy-2-oxoglutarate aldolase/2-dehydro-3-deoxy-phosphogluconate aldolase n=1 Tax=Mycolicibacterium sp. S2-37 TaxID=2810297 RepID=UPI001A952905|nr:bifunctional 4-hydroxy-2-oxoglutarate aldolase/2-dehydro-3-deoxy-phosphogluconate aldolase [Mycolicibacterium sp. S2-37]MBO0678486.1 bifunctional 4-hydroxy-2-oxoglutarate aldolase/2-dehydro-3-deoxy-phosphogluconate aldolase [Mycolicibacterium sp. S2-37]
MVRNTGSPDGTPLLAALPRMTTELARVPVLPVLRVDTAEEAVRSVALLTRAGFGLVELTATTPDWPAALTRVRGEHPDLLIGLGTVRDARTAGRAVEHGADFLVTPHPAAAVRDAVDAAVPVIEGGWTPGEIAAAADAGLAKLFPAHVGGPAYLRTLLAVLPGAAVVPTGGIGLDDVGSWLAAGATAVGVGSALVERLQQDPGAVADWLAGIGERS